MKKKNPPGLGAYAVCFGALLASLVGCGSITGVQEGDLSRVIERDAVPFEITTLPGALIDRLAEHRVVVIGETHFIREHREFVAETLKALHSRGFRQLLVEWPQAADWLLDDFVRDGGREPDWEPPVTLGGDLIEAVRDFNRSLPAGEAIRVRGTDVNLSEYGGAGMFLDLLGRLEAHTTPFSALTDFLHKRNRTQEVYHRDLVILRDRLRAARDELAESWGKSSYAIVTEMVEVELASVVVRDLRADHYDASVRLREDLMKRITDRRVRESQHGTVVNVGSTHAQKGPLRGTEAEWLGDYLAHSSDATGGSVFVLDVAERRILPLGGDGPPYFDLYDASPENELFRLMYEAWPERNVFLPFDDPRFASGGVPMNFEGKIWRCSPVRQYDGVVLLPSGHRVGVS